MQFLYATTDRGFWEHARLKLHGEGIRTWESEIDSTLTSLGSVFGQRQYRLYIIDNEDAQRANEILLSIGAYKAEPTKLPNGNWVKLTLLAVGALVVLAIGLLDQT